MEPLSRPSEAFTMPTLVTRFVLSGIKEEVSPARRMVVDKVRAWGVRLDDETTDAIRLVVSELVTNAVLHGVGPVTVELCHKPGSLVIGVLDRSEAMPEVDHPALGAEGGRGLGLVAFFAVRSGWEPVYHGKRVWAEVALPKAAPAVRAAVLRRFFLARPGPRARSGSEAHSSATA
ncbi:ATP-binding protein [Streptomyces massasporeus]|uniref:ATP-binding protein n=1 Tax=Streptomyces massasporeus TaxID=67324 RepID=UPI003815A1E6